MYLFTIKGSLGYLFKYTGQTNNYLIHALGIYLTYSLALYTHHLSATSYNKGVVIIDMFNIVKECSYKCLFAKLLI